MNVELIHQYVQLSREYKASAALSPEWNKVYNKITAIWWALSSKEQAHLRSLLHEDGFYR